MSGSIITVVGGSGFLGRYVVHRLAGQGYVIRVLCRHPSEATFLKPAGNVGQIVPDYADLAKPESLKGKVDNSAAVINLVGILYESGKHSFSRIHAQGAEKLAKLAKEAGVPRFVQVSALGVSKASNSTYARTKLAGEEAVRGVYPNATILRPSVLFGAEDNFFNQFARMSQFSPALPAIGGGETKFQPVYVDDVAQAITTVLERRDTAGKTYELGGPKVFTFKEILQYIGEVTGQKRALVPIPYSVAGLMGSITQLLPNPMLTSDQVRLLKYDNIVSEEALTFADLGITPTPVEAVVPEYLGYRKAA